MTYLAKNGSKSFSKEKELFKLSLFLTDKDGDPILINDLSQANFQKIFELSTLEKTI